ncbi:MAG: hypothetical protein FJW56_06145, partial [Actinobacteria bacterium]|nr:hypothetical protein [Actinomycetota bacterium]
MAVENPNVQKTSELRDYLILFLQNKFLVVSIFLICSILAGVYAYTAIDIYSANGSLRVSIPKSNVLSAPLLPEFQDYGTDRYIANEIEVLKSITLREIAAKSILDSFSSVSKNDSFYVLFANPKRKQDGTISYSSLVKSLSSLVDIEQKRGLDIITLKSESPSPFEAALIVNSYIGAYLKFNLETNRTQLTLARKFLEDQRKEKQGKLTLSEDSLKRYQEAGNIAILDEQARALVDQLSQFESQMNGAEIDARSRQLALNDFRMKLAKQDEKLAQYIQNL